MDKESWAFVIFITVITVICVPLVWFGAVRLEERTDWCAEKNGTMVKTVDGWRCIETKVLTWQK
jgi:hypothetical protein